VRKLALGKFLQASFGGPLVGTVPPVPGGTLKRSEVPEGSFSEPDHDTEKRGPSDYRF
jgi:hypothetical protein